MRKILLLVVGASICSLVFGEESDLFTALDSALPVSAEAYNTEEFIPGEIEAPAYEDKKASSVISGDPDIKISDFFRRRIPASEEKVPEATDGERLMWKLGEIIRDVKLPVGEYTVIRVDDRSVGYHIRTVGKVNSDGKNLTVTDTLNELIPGDRIVREKFPPLSLPPTSSDGRRLLSDTKKLGEVSAFLEPGQDVNMVFAGNRQLIGAKFNEYKGGNSVSIGAIMTIKRKGAPVAKAIVVDADLDLATLYVFESTLEVRAEDQIYTQ